MDAEKLHRLVQDFEADIDEVETQLAPLLNEPFESQAETRSGSQAAVPYALAAYSLSSLLFAYLRSEGEAIDPVQNEIARVQKLVEKLDAKPQPTPSPASSPALKRERKERAKASNAARQKQKKKMFK